MSASSLCNKLLLLCFIVCTARSQNASYPFATWMTTLSSQLADKTIFEIVFPGAHKSGMATISDTLAGDVFSEALSVLPTTQQQQNWAQTQTLSIYELLMHGVRFLDLSFASPVDNDSATFYCYHGLYGSSIHQVLDDIEQFLAVTTTSASTSLDLIILYVHDFLASAASSTPSLQQQELENLFQTIITHPIHSYLITPNIYDITTQTVRALTADGRRIIVFTDAFPSALYNSQWFFDADTYLFNHAAHQQFVKPNISDPIPETQSIILTQLQSGWPRHTLNLVHWIPYISAAFYEKYFFTAYFEFNAPFSSQWHAFIATYPRLFFGNVLLANFIDSSEIVQQSIALNLKYADCHDEYDFHGVEANDCPRLTDLADTFYQTEIPSQCQSTTATTAVDELGIDSRLVSLACKRSCGLCPTQTGYPGDACASDMDCNATIYDLFTADGNTHGTCAHGLMTAGETFCLSVSPQQSCVDYWELDIDQCGETNLSQCTQNCAADYDCFDGWCNPTQFVCMSYNISLWRTFADTFVVPLIRYWSFTVDDVKSVLENLEPLRPGNSSAPFIPSTQDAECDTNGADCVFETAAVNPYFASVLGLVLIPLCLSLFLFVCYCCLWPWWCCCEDWSKRHCCHQCCTLCYSKDTQRCCCERDPVPCIGTPEDSPWIHWAPCVVLGVAVVVSMVAIVQGLVANTNIHGAAFEEPDSLQVQTDDFLDEILARLTSVEPSARFIVNNGLLVLGNTLSILSKTYQIDQHVQEMDDALNTLAVDHLSNAELTTTVTNPFSVSSNDPSPQPQTTVFTIVCEKCESVSQNALKVRDVFDNIVEFTLRTLVETIEKFEPLYELRDQFEELTAGLFEDLGHIIETIESKQEQVAGFFTTASDYDDKYRETWIAFMFCVALLLVLLPLFGMLCRHKWCFRVNWCCAMWIGTLFMLITSVAALIVVVWGDFCVRLDDFEENQENSQFGQQLELDANTAQLVNACFTGQSVIEMYGLEQILDWDDLRRGIKTQLRGRAQSTIQFEEVALFKSQTQSLNTDEFTLFVDAAIRKANVLPDCGCGVVNISFTRQNLYNPITQCTSTETQQLYWQQQSGSECVALFLNASYAVQAEQQLLNQTQAAVAQFKSDASDVYLVYDTKIFPLGTELYNDLLNLSCTVDPLFEAIDGIIYNFSHCGFIGDYYGTVKENACVILFNETYYVARSLTIIAFMCILIVLFSYCMDYVYGPPALKRARQTGTQTSYDAVELNADDEYDMDERVDAKAGKKRTHTMSVDTEIEPGAVQMVTRRQSSAPDSSSQSGNEGLNAVNNADMLLKQQFLEVDNHRNESDSLPDDDGSDRNVNVNENGQTAVTT